MRDKSGETVALYVRLGRDRICVEEVESLRQIKFTAGKGIVFPLYVGSSAKVLLAELPQEDLALLLESLPWAPVGPNTILEKTAFMREVKKTQARGYAMSFGERVTGGASICVPVRGYSCPVAMSVLGPDNRLTRAVMASLQGEMKETAARIMTRLQEIGRRRPVR